MGVNKIKGYRVMSGLTKKEMAEKQGLSVRGSVLKENGTSSFKGSELSKIQTIFQYIKKHFLSFICAKESTTSLIKHQFPILMKENIFLKRL